MLPRFVTITGLDASFTLTGAPDATVTREGAVSMTVNTNSAGGYVVSAESQSNQLVSAQTPDNISISRLEVRDSQATDYVPMLENAQVVHRKDSPSAPGGDAVVNDYRVDLPFVSSDTYSTTTYSTTIDSIVAAQ